MRALLPILIVASLQAQPPKPQEIEAHARILGVLAKALPAPPPAWEDPSGGELPALHSVGKGQEREAMRFYLHRTWRNPAAIERARELQVESLARAKDDVQAQQERCDELQAARLKLIRPQAEALAKGDMATYQRYAKELEPLDAQVMAFAREADARQKEQTRRTTVRDQDFSIRLDVNEWGLGFGEAQPCAAPCPGVLAFRLPGGENDQGAWLEGSTHVLLGPWKVLHRKGAGLEATARLSRTRSYLAAQTLHIVFTGDEARQRDVMARVDWKALQELISAP